MRCAGPHASFHFGDLVEHLLIVAGEECAAIDDHVDLVGAGRDDLSRLLDFDVGECLAARETGGDRGDVDAAAGERLLHVRDHGRIDADGTDVRNVVIGGIGTDRLLAERPHLARGCPSPRAW